MPQNFHNKTALFNRLLEGKLSQKEIEVLIEWLGSEQPDPEAAELILSQLKQTITHEQINPDIIAALKTRLPLILQEEINHPNRRIYFLKSRWLRYAAAMVILFSGIGGYFLLSNKTSKQTNSVSHIPAKIDVAPGKEGAILTLDDGRTIVLDSLGSGLVAAQNGSKVLLRNGQLVYNADGSTATKISYNTLVTPKGRQFQIVLPDGTKAWLNAASSLRYPTIFSGGERKVEVTGEVYFEVTKNEKMPFRVMVNDETKIEVLGTHFNINSYKNEAAIKTTLLEGMVRIFNGDEKIILKPGQQAQVDVAQIQSRDNAAQPRIKVVNEVDLEKVMAWKNGVFDFQDATLEEVMRQLERWYDIDITYEKGIPKLEFMGKMGRDLTLSEVLRGLEISKVHFRLEEGRRLVVLP
ncbi:MAG: FecR family protein [Chitinophagales bacterium]